MTYKVLSTQGVEVLSPAETEALVEQKLSELPAAQDGKSVELQKTETAIQWRQTGGVWQDLVLLSEITGPKGDSTVTPGGGYSLDGVILLDSFEGSDDDKLDAALAYAASRSQIPYIQFPARTVTLNRGGRTPFSGMKLIGPNSPGPKNLEISGGKPVNHRVMLGSGVGTGANALFSGAGSLYDVYVSNLAFQGTYTQQFWDQPTGTLYACEFNSLTFYGLKHVFGRPGAKALMTQVIFTGHWTNLAFRDTQYTIGGSDNTFWLSGYLNLHSSEQGGGRFAAVFDACSKTNVGDIYSTSQNGWLGVRCIGNSRGLTFWGSRLEGRNASTPCDGSTFRVDGGSVTLIAPWIAYGMGNPTANGGNSGGVVHITGGNVAIERPVYEQANSVPDSTPLVYISGGKVDVSRAFNHSSVDGTVVVRRVGGQANVDGTVVLT